MSRPTDEQRRAFLAEADAYHYWQKHNNPSHVRVKGITDFIEEHRPEIDQYMEQAFNELKAIFEPEE